MEVLAETNRWLHTLHISSYLEHYITCATGFPMFWRNCHFMVKKWLQRYHSKYWSSLTRTFFIFLKQLEYLHGRAVHLSSLSTNQTIWVAFFSVEPMVSQTKCQQTNTSHHPTVQHLRNMAGGVGLRIWGFLIRCNGFANVSPGVVMLYNHFVAPFFYCGCFSPSALPNLISRSSSILFLGDDFYHI